MGILNVGCGERGTGDANTDIKIPNNRPANFCLMSAENLAFKDKSFEVVESYFCIKHLTEPTKLVTEATRVASKRLLIYTDNGEPCIIDPVEV